MTLLYVSRKNIYSITLFLNLVIKKKKKGQVLSYSNRRGLHLSGGVNDKGIKNEHMKGQKQREVSETFPPLCLKQERIREKNRAPVDSHT